MTVDPIEQKLIEAMAAARTNEEKRIASWHLSEYRTWRRNTEGE